MLMIPPSFFEIDDSDETQWLSDETSNDIFSELGCSISKHEIAGIGSLKRAETEVCGMKNNDLAKDAVKIH